MSATTRVYTHPACRGHRLPYGYPERPERLERILDGLGERGVEVVEAEDHPGAARAIGATHSAEYLGRFERAVARGDGLLDSRDNPLVADTREAALGAVSALLAAADWAVAGAGRHAFAAVRPPGHHAERDLAMGFCYLANVAIAARHLAAAGCERLAIFDFDVHHGNGTQHLFEADAEVLFASVHQYPFYPGTGAASERGVGDGEGATLNVPLAAGSGDPEYREAIDGRVLPALAAHRGELLLVSAGFDAWRRDPLGGMRVGEAAYGEWGERLGSLAAAHCRGRVVSALEGGYDVDALPALVATYLDGVERGLDGPS